MNKHPPAFPVTAENGPGHVDSGMTLRDYFAAKVMAGLLASGLYDTQGDAYCATASFGLADAMLRAREE